MAQDPRPTSASSANSVPALGARLRRRLPWLVLLAVLAAGAVWWFTRAVAVPAVQVQQAPLVRTLQVTARVATLSRVDVGATLTGRVQQVLVTEGERVRAGQVLVQLESQELRAAWLQAQANEQQALARVQGLRTTGRSAAQAAVAQAQAQLVAAQAELNRSRALVAQGFISASRLDELQRAVDVAQAQRTSAQAQLQAIQDNGTDSAQAQAQVVVARAATAAALARLEQAEVRAPADAQVLQRVVEPGQIVQPGKALLNLALDGPTELVAQVDERFLDQLRVGQSATVVADAYARERMAARVQFIAPGVDAQRGAVEVKLALQGAAPEFLREDMSLSAEVETGRRDAALVLPLGALLAADGPAEQGRVLVATAGRAEERVLRLGLRTLVAVEVLEGLSAGDVVLLASGGQGGKAVRAGDRVQARLQTVQATAQTPAARSTGPDSDAGTALTQAVGR